MTLKRLSERELRMNQQAAAVAATVLGQQVEAATRCEQLSTKAVKIYPGGGKVFSKQVPNCAGLPESFILAVTTSHVHALEDKQHRGDLVAGRVLKSWDRTGLTARTGNPMVGGGVPDDREVLILRVPIDGDANRVAQQIANQRAAAGQQVPGLPHSFVVGRDPASRRVVDALAASPVTPSGGGPNVSIGSNVKLGSNVRIGGQRVQDIAASAASPAASPSQRLLELQTLRATGAISDAEYQSKRQQIIAEI